MHIFRIIITSLLIACQYLLHSFLTIYLVSEKAGMAILQLEDNYAMPAFARWFDGSMLYISTGFIFLCLMFLTWKKPITSFFKGESTK